MTALRDIDRRELKWLAQHVEPVWGGHLDRGEPVQIGSPLEFYLSNGLIKCVKDVGYIITARGKVAAMTVRADVDAVDPTAADPYFVGGTAWP